VRALVIVVIVLGLALAGACGGKKSERPPEQGSAKIAAPAQDAQPATTTGKCTDLPFAPTAPVPEASGAAWLDFEGKPALFVISDSGNKGKYAIVDAETGDALEEGTLPLGEGSDDLEGVATRGGLFHVISSPGWIRVYKRVEFDFHLVDGPYALGPIDLEARGTGPLGDKPPEGNGMVCAGKHTNCGRNYEGLCLAPEAITQMGIGKCIGFAASKSDGHLYCLSEDKGHFVVQRTQSIKIARPGVVADCAFADDGRLYVGSNLFDSGHLYRVDNWQVPAEAKATNVGEMPIGFPETLAVRGDAFYRMSDTGATPSMTRKLRCPGR
jgi:hypothetical protein